MPAKQHDFCTQIKSSLSKKDDISTVPSVSSNPPFISNSEHHGDFDNDKKPQLTQTSVHSVLPTDISINPLDKSTAGCSTNPDIEMAPKNEICDDTFQSAEDDKINKAVDPGSPWIHLSTDGVAYWLDCGPTDCQHHDGPFDKSWGTFAKGIPTRYCSQKLFYGITANGEQCKREWLLYCSPSTRCVYCFVSELFVTKGSTHLADKDWFSDWSDNIIIDNHEQSATHRDYLDIFNFLSLRVPHTWLTKIGSVTGGITL